MSKLDSRLNVHVVSNLNTDENNNKKRDNQGQKSGREVNLPAQKKQKTDTSSGGNKSNDTPKSVGGNKAVRPDKVCPIAGCWKNCKPGTCVWSKAKDKGGFSFGRHLNANDDTCTSWDGSTGQKAMKSVSNADSFVFQRLSEHSQVLGCIKVEN